VCGSNIPLNFFSESTGLLGNETKIHLKVFKLSDIKFSRFSAPYNFDVIKEDEGTQMETREL
jgi:hypothetical protein